MMDLKTKVLCKSAVDDGFEIQSTVRNKKFIPRLLFFLIKEEISKGMR